MVLEQPFTHSIKLLQESLIFQQGTSKRNPNPTGSNHQMPILLTDSKLYGATQSKRTTFSGAREPGIWGERTLKGGGRPEQQPTLGSGQILISELNYPSKSGPSTANVQRGKSSFPGSTFSVLASIRLHRASRLAPAWPLSFGYNSEIVPRCAHHPRQWPISSRRIE